MNQPLNRIPSQGKLAGIAAGIAQYLAIDVNIVRIILVLGLIFTHGLFLCLYIILWVVLPVRHHWETPENPYTDSTFNSTLTNMKKESSKVWGIILIILGTIFLLEEWIPEFDFGKFWPLILVATGGYLIFKDKDKINFNNDKTDF